VAGPNTLQTVAPSDDSESDPDGYLEPSNGISFTTSSTAGLPGAFKRRSARVQKGQIACILPSAKAGEYMADHPFWVVRVRRITKKKHTIQYLGDKFLGNYYALRGVNKTQDHTDVFAAGSITFLHWDIKMIGAGKTHFGKISHEDLKVLSSDRRVAWQLESDTAEMRATSAPKERKARGGRSGRGRLPDAAAAISVVSSSSPCTLAPSAAVTASTRHMSPLTSSSVTTTGSSTLVNSATPVEVTEHMHTHHKKTCFHAAG
jgi:hypothetical protein